MVYTVYKSLEINKKNSYLYFLLQNCYLIKSFQFIEFYPETEIT